MSNVLGYPYLHIYANVCIPGVCKYKYEIYSSFGRRKKYKVTFISLEITSEF